MQEMDVISSIYRAFSQGNIEAILAVQSSNVVWTIAGKTPYSGTYRGPEGALQFFQRLGAAVEMQEFQPQRFVDGGDTVVVIGRERMTARSTGKPIENRWVHVWSLAGGKVTAFEEHLDSAAIEAAFVK